MKLSGAVDQNNLEPNSLSSILDELKEWGRYIEAEPEITHKLRAFDKAACKTDARSKKSIKRPNQRPGPSL